MEYTTKGEIENYLKRDIASSFDGQVTKYIKAMSGRIDDMVGYPVYRDAETEHKYDGNNKLILLIDPVHTISAVTVDGTTVSPTEAPYNKDIKTELIFESDYFSKGLANVSVTGVHALAKELPDTINHACTVFCAMILNQVDHQVEGVASEKIGEYQVAFRGEQDRADYEAAKEMVFAYKPLSF